MRSSAARLTLGAAAWIAFGAAASFIVQSEQQLTRRREAVRLFDVRASEAAVALADVRIGQPAYFAPGQNLGTWTARINALLTSATASLNDLQQTAADAESQQALAQSVARVIDLQSIDQRAREYLNSAQPLMAADVVFSEGLEMAAAAGRQLEAARIAEHATWDIAEAATRRLQAYSAGGAAALSALVIGVLALARPSKRPALQDTRLEAEAVGSRPDFYLHEGPEIHAEQPAVSAPPPPGPTSELPRESLPMLQAAVAVCTELNRARDLNDLNALLGRAASIIDAPGVIVWVGSAAGATLRPVLAHGYSAQALARMPPVARSDDNAAAAAFRTGELQIVCKRPAFSSGALAAPMLSREGCIGALTAEIKNGGETSPAVQAIAGILAAQFAGILADAVAVGEGVEESQIASA